MIWLFPYQPSTNIIPRAKALGMILVSRVDTRCDTEALRMILVSRVDTGCDTELTI